MREPHVIPREQPAGPCHCEPMKRSIILVLLAACSVEGSSTPALRPILPEPVLDIPAGVRRVLGLPAWQTAALVATDQTLLILHVDGSVSEVSAQGVILPPPPIPSDVNVLCAAGAWVGWWSARGIGRRTPVGTIEEHPFASQQPGYQGIVADERGIYWLQWRIGALDVWGWTSGAPARIDVPIPTTFSLVAVDANYVYGSEHDDDGMGGSKYLVRYSIGDGARELLVQRDRYNFNTLPPFSVNDDRLLYQRGEDVFVRSMATSNEEMIATIPTETESMFPYTGIIALADDYAWFGKYRLSTDGSESVRHYLGAPSNHYISELAVIGDRIAWMVEPNETETSGGGTFGGQPTQLFIADTDIDAM